MYLLFVLSLWMSQTAVCREDVKAEAFKVFNYRCYNGSDSILLPDCFVGPKYYNYEEGTIIGFMSPGSVTISILCGGNAVLTFDKRYSAVDTIRENGRIQVNQVL
jgi:hypothetical protein